jgi:hypothetical protein
MEEESTKKSYLKYQKMLIFKRLTKTYIRRKIVIRFMFYCITIFKEKICCFFNCILTKLIDNKNLYNLKFNIMSSA